MDRRKILVVEDEYTTRRMLSFNLKQQGYDVCEAEDGTEGLELALSEKPDLILLDIMMPGENGFEVCKKIRAAPELANIPVLVLTARAGLADKKFAFKAGADDYLTKPVGLDELNQRIEKFIKKVEKTEAEAPPPEPGQVVAIFGPQRKLGTTTLATNLSSIVCRQNEKHPVVLIDLVLPAGDVASQLGLDPKKHIVSLLAHPTSQITLELVEQYLQTHDDGYSVIAAPATATDRRDRPSADILEYFLDLLVKAGYIVILDLGSTLNELNFTAIRLAHKVFILTSGQPSANEALNNFLSLARKLDLDLGRLLPVVNQIQGPIGQHVVLARTPVARIPHFKDESDQMLWTNELALQKLNTVITT